jgi:D-xylose transport system permease protein
MDLLGLAAGTKFIVTGLVLLAAVMVDSLSKKGRASAGLV